MSWLLFAFSGPVLWAISTHLDKYLVERYFKHSDVAVLLIFTALIGAITLPFIWYLEPKVVDLSFGNAALMALSGVLYLGGMLFYLRALQTEEASAVAPFFQAAPLFGFVLGYLVLGETLSPEQMVGGALIVGGTLLVSLRAERRRTSFNWRLAALMLTCALSLAVSSLIFKMFALRDDFWPTTFWMFVGEALFGTALLAVRSYRRQFIELLRSNPGAVLTVNAVNELINLGGSLGTRYALLLAPLGIVQAIGSTTTLFVFVFGVLLSVFFPRLGRENLSRRELLHKGAAAVLVAVGALLVTR
ncbi:MAG TPA: EamA family transporter [Xanthobacteraceae bacterium]|jgi:drug/metabolite transporter (DMT)-like permease